MFHKMACLLWVLSAMISCGESAPPYSTTEPIVFPENEDTTDRDQAVIPNDSIKAENADSAQNEWRRIMQFEVEDRLMAYGKENKETRFKITTKYGDIKVKLYNGTPLHRANMILMIKKGIFNNIPIYRATRDFLIQGGMVAGPNAYERMAAVGKYQLPTEAQADRYPHVRGAFGMAGDDLYPGQERNSDSNPLSFYIIVGSKQNEASLESIEKNYGITITKENKEAYIKHGGAPHLDHAYTVCGEVYSGMSIVDKISKVRTNQSHRPEESIYISVEIIED